MRVFLISTCALLASIHTLAAAEPQQYWTSVDRVNRRTCPSVECGVVGQLFFRNSVKVYETKNEWGRITEYYDASCVRGVSEYVDKGDKSCSEKNGVVDGRFAEWVSVRLLSSTRPPDPAAGAEGYYKLVANADDYRVYKDIFAQTAKRLVEDGTCRESDFAQYGAWSKSSSYGDRPVYFMYCGGGTLQNRLYLDASTGKTFR